MEILERRKAGLERKREVLNNSVVIGHIIIFFIFVFQDGRKHDSRMLADSRVYNELATNSFDLAGHPLCLYGDPAYPLRVHLQAPFKNAVLTQKMEDFNNSMSAVHSSVEWLFSDVINGFKFLDFKKNLKIGLSSVGKMYVVSALLRNVITCLYGNTTLQIFMIISLKLSFTNKLC